MYSTQMRGLAVLLALLLLAGCGGGATVTQLDSPSDAVLYCRVEGGGEQRPFEILREGMEITLPVFRLTPEEFIRECNQHLEKKGAAPLELIEETVSDGGVSGVLTYGLEGQTVLGVFTLGAEERYIRTVSFTPTLLEEVDPAPYRQAVIRVFAPGPADTVEQQLEKGGDKATVVYSGETNFIARVPGELTVDCVPQLDG